MRDEAGYVLLITIIIVCMMTFSVLALTSQTINASFLAMRRTKAVQALSLAESAALEGLWQLQKDPAYRSSQERHWKGSWYKYSVVDDSPGTFDDPDLKIIGVGYASDQTCKVELSVHRVDVNSDFEITEWKQK